MTGITEHLGEIRARMARAAARSGRAETVTLVAVSKGHGADTVRHGLAAGLRDFGENYLQEALPKISAAGPDPVWHFIGRVQSNKTREIAANFAWVQTVASARIAERLAAQRPHHGPPLQVCIQLEPVAGEPPAGAARAGCARADVAALAGLVAALPRLRLRGLMLLPHAALDEPALRMEYRGARQLFDALNERGLGLDTLSMGMSGDYETAIEEGSTMIRIGTALLGART